MKAEEATTPEARALLQRKYDRRWWTVGVLSFSLVLIALDVTVLNVAIPTIQRELDASASGLQWILSSYILIFAGLLLTMGALGDRYGRRAALQAGLAIFGLASLGAGFADTSAQLIVARFAQGIGGALIMPSTLSVIVDVFPRDERPKAIGVWAGVAALGIPLGMIAGGWLIEEFSWNWIFLINVPLVAVIAIGSQLLVPESKDPQSRRIDLVGAGLSLATLSVLVYTIIEAPVRGWLDGLTIAGFVAALVGGAAFVAFELRVRDPMLDIRFFRNPRLSAGVTGIGIAFMSMLGMMFVLTQYLQFAREYTALEAGVRFTPMALGFMIGAPSSAVLVVKLGSKRLMGGGLMIVAGVMLGLAFLTITTPYWAIGLGLVTLGLGMAFTMAPATDAVMAALPEAKAGVGSALNDTFRQVGGALGVGIFGSILNSVYSSRVSDAVQELPAAAAAAAQNSIGAALQIAAQAGGEAGEALRIASADAFVDGLGVVFVVTAIVAFLGALFVFRYMPAHDVTPEQLEHADEPQPAPVIVSNEE